MGENSCDELTQKDDFFCVLLLRFPLTRRNVSQLTGHEKQTSDNANAIVPCFGIFTMIYAQTFSQERDRERGQMKKTGFTVQCSPPCRVNICLAIVKFRLLGRAAAAMIKC